MLDAKFIFVICQVGAENALKRELARTRPELKFAFSRPGFVTFKLPAEHGLEADFDLHSVFARTAGFSLGKLTGETAEDLADQFWRLVSDTIPPRRQIHVWERDAAAPGEHGFEPGLTELADEVGRILVERMPAGDEKLPPPRINHRVRSGEFVWDVVLVEPREWWVGCHQAALPPSRWPGGVPEIDVPENAVSRAYWKMVEGLLWSKLPIEPGDRCVEIGSSPGGSCQALLDRGLIVTGIDPAEMDEAVLAHPNFTHIRARGADLKRREFRKIKWLMADSNVAPAHTLDTVEHIVTHDEVNVRGLLLTLKLLQWDLADAIPEYLERVRSWGFEYVRARQLAFNRQEICVAALRRRAMRRKPPKSK